MVAEWSHSHQLVSAISGVFVVIPSYSSNVHQYGTLSSGENLYQTPARARGSQVHLALSLAIPPAVDPKKDHHSVPDY
jgi:hypothetical protein